MLKRWSIMILIVLAVVLAQWIEQAYPNDPPPDPCPDGSCDHLTKGYYVETWPDGSVNLTIWQRFKLEYVEPAHVVRK